MNGISQFAVVGLMLVAACGAVALLETAVNSMTSAVCMHGSAIEQAEFWARAFGP
jgi:hypothetical protein